MCVESRYKQLEQVISGASLGYWDWNCQTGEHHVNDHWLDMLGLCRDDEMRNESDWSSRVHPGDSKSVMPVIQAHIESGDTYVVEFRMKHKQGHWVWIQGSGAVVEYDHDNKPLRLCGIHQDISDRKRMEDELHYLAAHDPLTGLHNRNVLEKQLGDEIRRAIRYKHTLSVFMVDIDHFKPINDTHGHQTGDTVLRSFAKVLDSSIRQTDYAARYGGEEFVVILPETPLAKAKELAERLRSQVADHPFPIESDKEVNLTASIGIATFPEYAQSWQDLLEVADSAMYAAKKAGRNQVKTP
ncbi:MAG: sensor domain-containing diguanylate cyclase [Gammaproteobacteria bacterium]|nr:sensor domain-containing diguanylate cyclase [Gammaproteobacteria bacterium]